MKYVQYIVITFINFVHLCYELADFLEIVQTNVVSKILYLHQTFSFSQTLESNVM